MRALDVSQRLIVLCGRAISPRMPRRRRLAHPPPLERNLRPIIIFLTVCTASRKPLLARNAAHELLHRAWSVATTWDVGRYVVLPDHVHMFCAPRDDVPLLTWVRYWKTLVSRHWPWPSEQPIWQRDYWDTQLRSDESYEAKWEYVRNNPVRHGLISGADAWPYAGELRVLDW